MTSKFKTLESDGKVLHVDVSVFTKATVAEQVAFISEKTKEGFTINMCEFPKLSISQINVLLTSYKANPALTLVSLDNTLEVSTPEEKEVYLTFREISQLEVVRQAGQRQQYIDQALLVKGTFPFLHEFHNGL